jgi:SAM-dependent methyltransferase
MTTPRPTTIRLQHMVRAYRESATLMAAIELGLFTKLARGADCEDTLITALGIQPLHGERLIIACIALGLIEREGDRLRNAADVERFLIEEQPAYAGAWMLFTKPDWAQWGDLSAILASDDAPEALSKTVADFTVQDARRYHSATYSIGRGAGRLFLRQVDLSKRTKILDLGGGSGAYCIEALKKHPHLRACVFDLPPVTVVAREFIAQNNLTDRIDTVGGNFNTDPFPTDADVVIMASNLPMCGRQQITAIMRKAHDALLPGGEMHLVGETLNAERDGPADAAMWGLGQSVANSFGLAHSVREVEGYFNAAGFNRISTTEFVPGVLTRTVGYKTL